MSQYSPQELPRDLKEGIEKMDEENANAIEANEGMYYSKFVESKFKTGRQILESWGIAPEAITGESAHKMSMLHAVIGVAGEAGELLDAVKKYGMYNKPMDLDREENIQEELGDIKFYNQALVNELNLFGTITDFGNSALESANRKKLDKRYKNGYSDKAAQVRADKIEEDLPIYLYTESSPGGSQDEFVPSEVMFPKNHVDLFNWCRNKVVIVPKDHADYYNLFASLDSEVEYWIPEIHDREGVAFCRDGEMLAKFIEKVKPLGE